MSKVANSRVKTISTGLCTLSAYKQTIDFCTRTEKLVNMQHSRNEHKMRTRARTRVHLQTNIFVKRFSADARAASGEQRASGIA